MWGANVSFPFFISFHVAVTQTVVVDINHLSVGMFVHLDVGWLHHPFRSNRFRIASQSQIQLLQSMGLKSVRCVAAANSEQILRSLPLGAELPKDSDATPQEPEQNTAFVQKEGDLQLAKERLVLSRCDQNFSHATELFLQVIQQISGNLNQARASSESVVSDCVAQLLEYEEPAIHLLSENVGERNAHHPVNVMVLCLLLGKIQGMGAEELRQLGLAALLHDVGKLCLPVRLANRLEGQTSRKKAMFESHVGESVALAEQMGLASEVVTAIAQHHEMADGSGFPLHLLGEDMGAAGKVIALVNCYDGLCNPSVSMDALTPHEALAQLFVQKKTNFDSVALADFIRMMGVYPPGSIVQLSDERYALVVSVSAFRPLRPRVLVYDPKVPRNDAVALPLEEFPLIGIRCSLKPSQLPRSAFQYLSPRKRISYFFERSMDPRAVREDGR